MDAETYDKMLGQLHGIPDIDSTKPTTVRAVVPMIGTSQTFIVQTYRRKDEGDTIFLECTSREGVIRIALPPPVCSAIARQSNALGKRARSKSAKAQAQARKDRGELPGFMHRR